MDTYKEKENNIGLEKNKSIDKVNARDIINHINNSYFRGDLSVMEIEKIESVILEKKILIHGKVSRKDAEALKKFSAEIYNLLCSYNEKVLSEADFAKSWKVETIPFAKGDTFEEIELINIHKGSEKLSPFPDEICLIEFYDLEYGVDPKTKELKILNSFKKFRDADLKDKGTINYIGIADIDAKPDDWKKLISKFNIFHDGKNYFQYMKTGIAKELGIEDMPYACIVDTQGRIQFAGNPRKIQIVKFLKTLYSTGEGDLEEIECECIRCKLFAEIENKDDPNPTWSDYDKEIQTIIVSETNDLLRSKGISGEMKVTRKIFYEGEKETYVTNLIISGHTNRMEEELIESQVVTQLKDIYGFGEIQLARSSSMGGLGVLALLESLNKELGK